METLPKQRLSEAVAVTHSYKDCRIHALRGVGLQIYQGDFIVITDQVRAASVRGTYNPRSHLEPECMLGA